MVSKAVVDVKAFWIDDQRFHHIYLSIVNFRLGQSDITHCKGDFNCRLDTGQQHNCAPQPTSGQQLLLNFTARQSTSVSGQADVRFSKSSFLLIHSKIFGQSLLIYPLCFQKATFLEIKTLGLFGHKAKMEEKTSASLVRMC